MSQDSALSRRGFITGTAALATAASAIALAPQDAQAKVIAAESDVWKLDEVGEPTEEMDCDIVICGGGGTGMACACQAAQLGLNVIVLEKMGATGGSFVCTEGMFACQSHWTEEVGEDFTVDEAVANCMDFHHWVPQRDQYKVFFAQTGETIQWLEDLGVKFAQVIKSGGPRQTWHVYERDMVKGPGSTFQESMLTAAQGLGVQIECETSAKRIVMQDGKVAGVIAERSDGTVVRVNAPCCALATGGYTQNIPFVKAVAEATHEKLAPQGLPGRDADGIKMAREAGANMAEGLGTVVWCGPIMTGAMWTNLDYSASVQPVLWINQDCERFVNEDRWFSDFAATGIAQRNQRLTYTIFTEADLASWENNGPYYDIFSFCLENDPMTGVTDAVTALESVVRCETIEDAAAAEGLDAEALRACIDTYNGYCDAGEDAEFGKDPKYLHRIEPPFYIAPTEAAWFCTVGGISVTPHCEVRTETNEVIPGLYAGGCDAGGLYGDSYDVCRTPGSQASWANNSGRLIAKAAATYLGK